MENYKLLDLKKPLNITSVSLGSYKGDLKKKTDLKIFNSFCDGAMSGGINYFDTSINFRYEKSERVINSVLKYLINEKMFLRNEFMIGTKGGFLNEDADIGFVYEDLIKELLDKKILDNTNEIFDNHCLNPKFIDYQFEKSRVNLGIECIDFYCLNLPEVHLSYLSQEELFDKIIKNFTIFEEKISQNKLQAYGISTWRSLRVNKYDKYYINIEKLKNKVDSILGKDNNFKIIQAPFNMVMPEIFIEKNQTFEEKNASLLSAAEKLKLNIFATSSFCSGLTSNLPLSTHLTKNNYLGAKHLNFLRSFPFKSLKTNIFGAKNNRHVKTNLNVVYSEMMIQDEIEEMLFSLSSRKQKPEEEYEDFKAV